MGKLYTCEQEWAFADIKVNFPASYGDVGYIFFDRFKNLINQFPIVDVAKERMYNNLNQNINRRMALKNSFSWDDDGTRKLFDMVKVCCNNANNSLGISFRDDYNDLPRFNNNLSPDSNLKTIGDIINNSFLPLNIPCDIQLFAALAMIRPQTSVKKCSYVDTGKHKVYNKTYDKRVMGWGTQNWIREDISVNNVPTIINNQLAA